MTNREIGLLCAIVLAPATFFFCCTWEQTSAPGSQQDLVQKLRTVWESSFGGLNHRVVLRDSFDMETAHFIGVKCPVVLVLVGTIMLLRGDRDKK